MLLGFRLQGVFTVPRLEIYKQTPNTFPCSPKTVFDHIFHHKVPGVLPAIVVLYDGLAQHYVAQEDIFSRDFGHAPADSNEQGKLDVIVA